MSEEPPASEGKQPSKVGQALRWLIVAAILSAGLLILFFKEPLLCGGALAPDGGVRTLCRPPQIGDPAVFIPLVAIGLLMWPEISEFGVPGIFSIKRRLEETRKQVETQAHRLGGIEQQLNAVNARVDAAVTSPAASAAPVEDTIMVGPEHLERVSQNLQAKQARFAGGADDELSEPEPAAAIEPEAATEAQLLIQAWEQLKDALGLDAGLQAVTQALVLADRERRDRFLSLFREEIATVRAARNAAAHGRPLTAPDLHNAAEIAQQLLRIWRGQG